MPKVVLNYFNAKGLGESIRLLLAYGGQEFEDKRFSDDEWEDFKARTPFGSLPVLDIDGKQYAQSIAIGRYLGRKYGLAGCDTEQEFEIDQNVAFYMDIIDEASSVHYEPDEALKKKKHEEYTWDVYPDLFEKLNDLVIEGYIACGKLTWGDFIVAGTIDDLKHATQIPDLDTKYSMIKRLVDNVMALPKVKEYIENVTH